MHPIRIALRYLFARKSHSAVNIISAVSMAGIAVATAAIVCVLSVFNGFSDLAYSRLSVFDPELKITPTTGKLIANADSIGRIAEGLLPAGTVVQPVVEEQALAAFRNHQLTVTIKGVPHIYLRRRSIEEVMIDGQLIADVDPLDSIPYATLGVGVAIRLEARPGREDFINLYLPKRIGRINPANPMGAFRADSAFVSGVFQLDQAEYDNDLVILPLERARKLLDLNTEATAIEIALPAGYDADKYISKLQEGLGSNLTVADRLGQHAQSYRMIVVEKWISLLLLVFILVIASFNVLSSISMLVLEKSNDVAILQALGATPGWVNRIFADQGAIITLLGGAIGLVLGSILCLAQQYGGFIRLNGDPSQLSIQYYPVSLYATDLLLVAATLIAVAALIALLSRAIAKSVNSSFQSN